MFPGVPSSLRVPCAKNNAGAKEQRWKANQIYVKANTLEGKRPDNAAMHCKDTEHQDPCVVCCCARAHRAFKWIFDAFKTHPDLICPIKSAFAC